jgi:glutaminyl-peptide cyclotransferase
LRMVASYLLLFTAPVLAYTTLKDESLRSIPGPGKDFDIKDGALLAPILIPRVSGTEGNTKVLNHFVDFFHDKLPKWHLSFQNSTSKTPATGDRDIPFINIIARREPPWSKEGEVSYMTVAAHYDSKLTPDGFIGATDSAAPCAMIMHTARSLDGALTKKWDAMTAEGVGEGGFGDVEENKGVQIILFDGEEAFKIWNDEDSIYGARSLAAEWEDTFHPATSTFRGPLESISLFLLLDLLGDKSPLVPSYFPTTHWAYQKMADVEARMRGLGLFKSSPNHPSKRHGGKAEGNAREEQAWLYDHTKDENSRWYGGAIGDDHMPFLQRGVQVLHMIPSPFPRTWHTMDDNGEHLDPDTTEDWALLTTAFISEWMDLEGFMVSEAAPKQAAEGATRNRRDEL